MANWCYNEVEFFAGEKTMQELEVLFQGLSLEEIKTHEGQLPEFIKEKGGYFFSVVWDREDKILQYETKWSPNLDRLKEIADKFGCGFECRYEETGCQIYGRAVYREGVMDDTCLEYGDFDRYQHDEQANCWYFEGEAYESEYPILDLLLDEKINLKSQYLKS